MRIGLIAPPWIPVPPPSYGGTEVVVDNLARGLTALGHDVRLFTVGDSTCPVTRLHYFAHPAEPMNETSAEVTHLVAAYPALADVDVIHDHTLAGPLLASVHPPGPALVVTHHGAFTPDLRRVFSVSARRAAVVAISACQAGAAGDVPIAAVIHHGIDTDVYRQGPGGGDLLFIGRMSPDKGADRALRVAHRAGRRLVIVTKMRTADERAYFDDQVRPLLCRSDELLVEPALADRLELLRQAQALLNPIAWPEPFGLVMAEALACGTPVLAFPNGAAPEIVEDGRTGYLCPDEDAMLEALRDVPDLDRRLCRLAAERRFSMQRMAADHELLYRRLLAARDDDGHDDVSRRRNRPLTTAEPPPDDGGGAACFMTSVAGSSAHDSFDYACAGASASTGSVSVTMAMPYSRTTSSSSPTEGVPSPANVRPSCDRAALAPIRSITACRVVATEAGCSSRSACMGTRRPAWVTSTSQPPRRFARHRCWLTTIRRPSTST